MVDNKVRHPNFKGGRVKTPNGYIIIFVGKKHHLSDCRGYAYEHRLVMENKIGRRLKNGEQIHHISGIKSDNSPDNLQLVESMAHHKFLHRKTGSDKKHPDEKNQLILCMCGCGKEFMKYDKSNRPRKYIPGHNPHERETMDALMKEIQNGKKSIQDLYLIGKSRASIRITLFRMTKLNMIVRVKPGEYGPIGTPKRQNPMIKCGCGCKETFYKFDKHWRERRYISGHNHRK